MTASSFSGEVYPFIQLQGMAMAGVTSLATALGANLKMLAC